MARVVLCALGPSSSVPQPDKSTHPLSYRFLSKLSRLSIDVVTLHMLRSRPALVTPQIARHIMRSGGDVVVGEVIRRLHAKDNPFRLPFDIIVDHDDEWDAFALRFIIMLYNRQEQCDRWGVVLGNVWSVLAPAQDNLDPFAHFPPDYDMLEAILEGLVEKVMTRLPMEVVAHHLASGWPRR